MPRGQFEIDWTARTNLGPGPDGNEIDQYICMFEGTLYFNSWSSSYDEKVLIGVVSALKVLVNSRENQVDVYGFLRSLSDVHAELADVLSKIEADDSSLICDVGPLWEICQYDYLFIQSITIHPDYRGLGLGLFAADISRKVLGSSMSLTLMKPVPFPLPEDSNQEQIESSTNRLKNHFSNFLRLSRVGGMIGSWSGYQTSHFVNTCPHLFK
jgi:hypothetical protein